MFLVNSRQDIFSCGPYCYGQALLQTYGCFFAEFLGDTLLVRLSLLDLSTCVGLRYGLVMLILRSFSRKRAHVNFSVRRRKFWLILKYCLPDLPNRPSQSTNANPIMRLHYNPSSLHRNITRSWNINHVSIESDFRHFLRTD